MKQVIVMRTDLGMRKGKMIAQDRSWPVDLDKPNWIEHFIKKIVPSYGRSKIEDVITVIND